MHLSYEWKCRKQRQEKEVTYIISNAIQQQNQRKHLFLLLFCCCLLLLLLLLFLDQGQFKWSEVVISLLTVVYFQMLFFYIPNCLWYFIRVVIEICRILIRQTMIVLKGDCNYITKKVLFVNFTKF